MAEETKLATGSLGTAESIIMGISGTAPAFSAAATTTALVAAVGIHSPRERWISRRDGHSAARGPRHLAARHASDAARDLDQRIDGASPISEG